MIEFAMDNLARIKLQLKRQTSYWEYSNLFIQDVETRHTESPPGMSLLSRFGEFKVIPHLWHE